jgi:aspartyl/asparaginyl beta-hydroxylase (cupin superfamily)
MKSRLERSVEAMKPNTLLQDGRRPVYFALLDLPSKPFWRADELRGVTELIDDLRSRRDELLEEMKALRGHDFGDGWSVFTVCGDGKEPREKECSKTLELLRRHSECVSLACPFQATLVSLLQPRGHVSGHFGPTNFRLRIQFPLSDANGCWIQCGKEKSFYEDGYAIIDDSYFHSAANPGDTERFVLIVDVWHPGM